ncbi:aminotransferase class I/II-fold pyridoxal phosphate-dependent enzyme [Lactobacillus helveticus]|uniref:aminotransferase class I/II-fold pyridoxal phosphate-dependent enzyme n=1 Tax=Lactobacillus helveticus TaxID=1587 RepID=UPI00386CABD8
MIGIKKRKGVSGLTKEDIGYENGVLGGVVSALKVFAAPGDKVLLHSPTYMGFTNAVLSNGYQIVHSPLIKDENGTWRMDYEDMDKKIKENQIHVAIFCNPHNPTGRVWTKEEITKAMEVYERNNVWVISDEIWSDLMMNDHHYTPTQSVSEWAKQHTAAFYAPSKNFNIAGLIGS